MKCFFWLKYFSMFDEMVKEMIDENETSVKNHTFAVTLKFICNIHH